MSVEFTWKTRMRALPTSAKTDEEHAELAAARAADQLRGQAAMSWLGDGRVQLLVMPDRGTFSSEVVISVDDAVVLAQAILDAAGIPR